MLVQRVQLELAEPYKQIKAKTRQLVALHDTIDLLRAVIKFLRLVWSLVLTLVASTVAVGNPAVITVNHIMLFVSGPEVQRAVGSWHREG